MQRLRLIIAMVAVAVVVVGCSSSGTSASGGSSGSSAHQADIDAVVAQVGANGGVVSHKQAVCIAEHSVPHLSAKGLKLARKSKSDITDLSKADQNVIFDGVSACVTTAQLSPSLEQALESGSNKVDAATAKCFVGKVEAAYPKSGELMKVMNNGTESKVADLMTSCLSSGGIRQELLNELTATGSFNSSQASCVVDKLLAEVPASELTGGASSGSLPPDLESKLGAAATACGVSG
jgi:hypothetical protein